MMNYYQNPMHGWGYHRSWGMFPGLFFFILLILGAILLVKFLTDRSHEPENNNRPLEILKERYAKGEINKSEFEEMKKQLK